VFTQKIIYNDREWSAIASLEYLLLGGWIQLWKIWRKCALEIGNLSNRSGPTESNPRSITCTGLQRKRPMNSDGRKHSLIIIQNKHLRAYLTDHCLLWNTQVRKCKQTFSFVKRKTYGQSAMDVNIWGVTFQMTRINTCKSWRRMLFLSDFNQDLNV
jgi:hypothetical protein